MGLFSPATGRKTHRMLSYSYACIDARLGPILVYVQQPNHGTPSFDRFQACADTTYTTDTTELLRLIFVA